MDYGFSCRGKGNLLFFGAAGDGYDDVKGKRDIGDTIYGLRAMPPGEMDLLLLYLVNKILHKERQEWSICGEYPHDLSTSAARRKKMS